MALSIRKYKKNDVISFAKTSSRYGELSNMAPHFPLFINEFLVYSSESLYQACKFPLYPNIQRMIIEQSNPMLAKEISRMFSAYVRSDWDNVKYKIMSWCISVKLIQNWDSFSSVLRSTGNKEIVEYSTKSIIWGAKPKGNYLVGQNALGRLLMQLRKDYIFDGKQRQKLFPPEVVGFLLFGYPIGIIYAQEYYTEDD